jgi:hypothetical protein
MTSSTRNLALEYIVASQAQKEVTHNVADISAQCEHGAAFAGMFANRQASSGL